MKLEIQDAIRVMRVNHCLDISVYESSFLHKALERRCVSVGASDLAQYIRSLADTRAEADALYQSLSITYSEFFRNPLTFALLEQLLLPRLVERKAGGGEIRIWSAGCAAGQEAYSLAILLGKHFRSSTRAVRYRIFATDSSQSALLAAEDGIYNPEALQNIPLKYVHAHFERRGDLYVINPELKNHIVFSHYDLLDTESDNPPESIYGNFDMVFCSNLLFYYRMELRQFILNKVVHSLDDQGYLVTSEAEREFAASAWGLRTIVPPAAIFQKTGQGR